MKKFIVNVFSFLIWLVLSVIDIVLIVAYAISIRLMSGEFEELATPDINGLYIFSVVVGYPFVAFVILILAVLILILVAETVIKTYFCFAAVKRRSYGFYLSMSIVALVEAVVNFIAAFFMLHLDVVSNYSSEFYEQVNTGIGKLGCIYLITGAMTVINIILSDKLAKNGENPNIPKYKSLNEQ
ncbi:MAG: hypothetical protein K5686_02630 [Lachnospiraceae bacterium]|nr:hypothetical protein [Lachnospiraceae bacterium]